MAITAEKYINELYDKQKKNTLNELRSAYDQNMQTLDNAESEITPQYYEAKRQASGDAAIRRQRLNETFAANGLNTGAVGQAQLALANQENANIAGINREEANARNAITQQRTSLETAYKNNVQQAIAAQDFERANALFQQYQADRAEAKAQVDNLVAAGVMPPADLISASGYSNAYVSKLYNAVRAKSAVGGSTQDSGVKIEEQKDGTYKVGDMNYGTDYARAELEKMYRDGKITYDEYKGRVRAIANRV